MDQDLIIWCIYKVLVDGDAGEHVAAFTDEAKANDTLARLGERAKDQGDEWVHFELRPIVADPSPESLGLPKTLREMGCDELLEEAYIILMNNGEMYVPLWTNPSWMVHEIKARYNILVELKGRQMKTLYSAGRDCGFTETEAQ